MSGVAAALMFLFATNDLDSASHCTGEIGLRKGEFRAASNKLVNMATIICCNNINILNTLNIHKYNNVLIFGLYLKYLCSSMINSITQFCQSTISNFNVTTENTLSAIIT